MFTHLHVHSEYSLLDGLGRLKAMVQHTKEQGMEALALTDHGVLYGAIQFYLAAKEAGVKPIIGCELYVAPGDHTSKTAADRNYFHLTALAMNLAGYKNLIQLTTRAHTDGYYYKPRVDHGLLEKYSEGLIVLSGCLNGEVAQAIQQGDLAKAERTLGWYRDTFPGRYFLELQGHDIPELPIVNERLRQFSKSLGIPVVATNDAHYVHRDEHQAHDILLCIGMNTSVNDEKRMRFSGDGFYLRSPQEMAALFKGQADAIENTQRITEMVDLKLEFNRLHLPQIDIPAGLTPDEYLAQLCWQGLRERYGDRLTSEHEERLRYELDVIRQTEFANYFLVVWDFVRFAREAEIPFGARGSAAGSIVLHCLKITDVDPIANKLVFERFLNIERKEMPDIDMDFADDRRGAVIDYIANRYGRDHVAQIVTFGTLGAKAAIRDVGRALGMTYGEVDRVAKLVPPQLHMTIDRALAESSDLRRLYEAEEPVRKLVDTAKQLEGVVRHASTHAAGIVISADPLTEHVPLQRAGKGDETDMLVTQYGADELAKIGLLKMDILGLANLTILSRTRALVQETRGVRIDLQNLPWDDKKTFDLLASGECANVFQLESAGMRRYIKELKPSSVEELAAMIALYRPGPMAHIPRYIRGKHGEEPPNYPHPALEPILRDTYGVIVYQDQVLFIVREIAGYSLGQADIFRKAMGKKIKEKMQEQREEFVRRAVEKGVVDRQTAIAIFDLIEPFAGYAFNRAHSACYAVVSYQTAYLKANYPVEYMAAVLMVNIDAPDKLAHAAVECRRLGIDLLPPDVNHSGSTFTIEALPRAEDGGRSAEPPTPHSGGAIRWGLGAVKNVGMGAADQIIAARAEGGPFTSIVDFCKRVDLRGLNKRVIESLIKAGAFDSLGNRAGLLDALDRLMAFSQSHHRLKESGQSTLFDLFGEAVPAPEPSLGINEALDLTPKQRLQWEKELLGVYISEHPFSRAALRLSDTVSALCSQIGEELAGQDVTLAGLITGVRTLSTREGRTFASVMLEDLSGSAEVTVWPETYDQTRELWTEDRIVIVQGRVKARDDRFQVVCEAARPFQMGDGDEEIAAPETPTLPEAAVSKTTDDVRQTTSTRDPQSEIRHREAGPPQRIAVSFRRSGDDDADLGEFRRVIGLFRRYPGRDELELIISDGHLKTTLALPNLRVRYCPELMKNLHELIGEQRVQVVPLPESQAV